MGKQNYYGQEKRPGFGQSGGIDSMAESYIPAIKKILLLEAASVDEIKVGVTTIENLVRSNSKVTTHQIRNIFSLIQDLKDEKDEEDKKGNSENVRLKRLHQLRPKLAYIGARQKEVDGKVIIKVLDELIKSIDIKDGEDTIKLKIKGLHYIMESIVAYHKFYSKN